MMQFKLVCLVHWAFATALIAQSPNILFIAVDDMNDWVGFMDGHPGMKIATPNIDRLAEQSMVFTNAHTPSPACAPARAAILTGVHHIRSGVENVHWGDKPLWRNFPALKDAETIEQFFKRQGYKTLGAGKIYHSQAPPWAPTSQVEPENWDFYYPSAHISHPYQIRAPQEVIFPDHVDNSTRPGGGWWTWGPLAVDDNKMADYHVVDWARYQLRQRHERPFFLAVGTWKPHDPWEVPQKYFDMYPLDSIQLPPYQPDDLKDAMDHGRRWIYQWVIDNHQWREVVQSYAASITFADAMVGRLLAQLASSEYADNTIIVLWADHGMHMGEKDNIEKFTLWERSTRVPLIVKTPDMTRGASCDQPVSLMDIYPTLAELTGYDLPDHLDGRSLVPQLKDPNMPTEAVVSSYRFSWSNKKVSGHAVRSKDFRYIYYPEIDFEELYDHRSDPQEYANIAYQPASSTIIDDHRKTLAKWLPQITWQEPSNPVGFTISEEGAVHRDGFEIIKQ